MGCVKSKKLNQHTEFTDIHPPLNRGTSLSTDKRLSAVMRAKRKGRDNVFSEKMAIGGINGESYVPRVVEKSEASKKSIRSALEENFLFNDIGWDIMTEIVDAMEGLDVAGGDVIIQQGDDGDYFYVIERGDFKVILNGKDVAELGPGGAFGELALMYNAPRAATVQAKSDGKLWKLDRKTFRHTLASQSHSDITQSKTALRKVPLLEPLSEDQLTKMAEAVQPVSFKAGEDIIVKGENGSIFYIIKTGTVVCKDIGGGNMNDLRLGPGDYFGERALLMGEPRAANVVAETACQCMVLDRTSFNEMLGPLKKVLDNNLSYRVLQSVPLLKGLTERERQQVAEKFQPVTFPSGTVIIQQGASGDDFFIIKDGTVKVTQEADGKVNEVAELKSGDYFGEMALLNSDTRKANVIAESEVHCFSLNRSAFSEMLGPLQTILEREAERRDTDNEIRARSGTHVPLESITLDELTIMGTLGTGTFGKVKLVQHKQTKTPYALKIMRKAHVVDYKQQTNVISEKEVMMQAKHPFILRLVSTMKDDQCLYMLIELCLGGELFNYLHCRDGVPEYIPNAHAQFYAACVTDAFAYLHGKDIIYRDLKPENLLIDAEGYIKVVDFGFAKVVIDRTYTLCGTPEYLAPELVLGKGHHKGVDYWALGVLIYEMLVGYSPFAGEETPDQMVICRNILACKCDYPTQIKDKNAIDLIKKLLTKDPNKRYGCLKNGAKDISGHVWFNGFDWPSLLERKMKVPWVPPIKNPLDTTHFDPFEEDDDGEQPYRDDGTGWDDAF